ncbi:MAG: hypothetical protein C4527_12155 [Candidatus Omnitrophota bacterium]|jgi:hypothetical protein|nr:MAG: hypothetical protein C4527_12155 [Candidatus Omnitrophota bacterium]
MTDSTIFLTLQLQSLQQILDRISDQLLHANDFLDPKTQSLCRLYASYLRLNMNVKKIVMNESESTKPETDSAQESERIQEIESSKNSSSAHEKPDQTISTSDTHFIPRPNPSDAHHTVSQKNSTQIMPEQTAHYSHPNEVLQPVRKKIA